MVTPAKNAKVCTEVTCPIEPEFWKDFGGILQALKDGDARMERMEKKIDQLNHIKKRGAQYGAAGGSVSGVVAAGVLVWLKSKFG